MNLRYEIRRSARRKKVTITVERDRSVVIQAPASVPEEKIRQLVESKRQWLYEKLQDARKYQPIVPPGKELVNGEAALYLGRHYRIELVDTGEVEVRFAGKFLIPRSRAGQRKQVLRQWYVERAQEKILSRVRMYAQSLGVTYQQAKISDSRLRWGSCTPGDNLHFNWRLIKAPMFAIDYVVVHELAHLRQMNHGPQFWSLVASVCPEHRALRDQLRRLAADLPNL